MAIPNTFADKTGEVLLGNLDYNFEVLDVRISNNQTQIENLDLRIDAIEGIDVDFTGYATETYVNNAVAAISEPSLSGYATETYVNNAVAAISGDTSNFLTGNETITLSGDLSGSGTTSINAQLGANVVGANELNVTGNGTTSQYLRSDGDGTFTWATPPDTTTNQTITLSGDASGSGTTAITVTVADNSHNHTSANISDATSANTANTIVKRDASGNFSAGTVTASLSGNASTATKWATGRTISLTGDVTGTSASFDGSGNASITATVADDSHNHIIGNVDGLQTALDAKAPIASPTFTGTATTPNLQITSGALVRDVTGNYGSIEIVGGATGAWEGYSIGGRAVFMHDNANYTGIYNDANNQWILLGTHNGATDIRHAGSAKLTTTSGGVTVTGTCAATSISLNGTDVTATATELNYTDGVTSNIQTQLNAKQPLDAELTASTLLILSQTVTK